MVDRGIESGVVKHRRCTQCWIPASFFMCSSSLQSGAMPIYDRRWHAQVSNDFDRNFGNTCSVINHQKSPLRTCEVHESKSTTFVVLVPGPRGSSAGVASRAGAKRVQRHP